MSSMLRVNSTFIYRIALRNGPLFARVMLHRMMNVFFRSVRRRDNADRAP